MYSVWRRIPCPPIVKAKVLRIAVRVGESGATKNDSRETAQGATGKGMHWLWRRFPTNNGDMPKQVLLPSVCVKNEWTKGYRNG